MGLLLTVYILGVLTLPVGILALLFGLWYYAPVLDTEEAAKRRIAATSEDAAKSHIKLIEGWVSVRRTYSPLAQDTTYTSMLTSGYKSLMDARSKDPRRLKARGEYYAILKQTPISTVLYLYECDPSTTDLADCLASLDCSAFDVHIYPVDKDALDGEIWTKRTCIVLKPRLSDVALNNSSHPDVSDSLDTNAHFPWFFFPKTNDLKEDWYYHLLKASHPFTSSFSAMFESTDMTTLMQSIDATSDLLPTRWLNGILGRLFLSVYRTQSIESWIVGRIVRKISRVAKPSYLSEIRVREVNVGSTIPLFSKPMIKEMSPDGSASMTVKVKYEGTFRITISTIARINLGARIKQVDIDLVLAAVLKEIEGTMIIKIKKPPSNRLWWGCANPFWRDILCETLVCRFLEKPKMSLSIEPVVSSKDLGKYTWITNSIAKRIEDVVLESIVLPNLDDIAFFDTRGSTHRAGIFDDLKRTNEDLATAPPDPAAEAEGEGEDGVSIENSSHADVAASGLRHRNVVEDEEDVGSLSRSTTDLSEGGKQHGRKRSWFGSSKSLLTPGNKSSSSLDSELNSQSLNKDGASVLKKPSNESVLSTDSSKLPRKVPPLPPKPSISTVPTLEENNSAAAHLTRVLEQNEMALQKSSGSNPPASLSSSAPSSTLTIDAPSPSVAIEAPSPSTSTAESVVSLNFSTPRRATIGSTTSHRSFESTDSLPLVETPQAQSREPSPSRLAPSALPEAMRPIPPPPKRLPEVQRKPATSSPPAKEQLMNAWKARNDKQALAQSYSTAKDALMKKWGQSNWIKGKDKEPQTQDGAQEAEIREAVMAVGLTGASSTSSSTPSRDYCAPSEQSRGQRSRGVSMSSGQAVPSAAQTTTSLNASPEPSNSFAYKAAPMMAVPGILDPAHRGGLGSHPVQLQPVRPGDAPEKPARILPPVFKWPEKKSPPQTERSLATNGAQVRKLPPPFVSAAADSSRAVPPVTVPEEQEAAQTSLQPLAAAQASRDTQASSGAEKAARASRAPEFTLESRESKSEEQASVPEATANAGLPTSSENPTKSILESTTSKPGQDAPSTTTLEQTNEEEAWGLEL